jgi:hypothetical protein
MARGWGKAAEDQEAEREQQPAGERVSEADAARAADRRTIELARARAAADLASATRPAHRAMLEAALRTLDEQLARRSQ